MKTRNVFLAIFYIVLLVACEKTDDKHGLPSGFPLKTGTAWVYERTNYDNGMISSTSFDTLFVFGTYEDYYLYSWNLDGSSSLVRNYDNKLIGVGFMDDDVTMFNEPEIWLFYGEVGMMDSTKYKNYYFSHSFSTNISIENGQKYLGELYDTYKDITIFENIPTYKERIVYYNELGIVNMEFRDEKNILVEKVELIKILNNVYPSGHNGSERKNISKISSTIYNIFGNQE